MFISVDLPEPDGPIRATYSPCSIVSVAPSQRLDLDLAQVVDLGNGREFNERQS